MAVLFMLTTPSHLCELTVMIMACVPPIPLTPQTSSTVATTRHGYRMAELGDAGRAATELTLFRVGLVIGAVMKLLIWLGIFVCISQTALLSGLNLAVFSVSRLRLEVEAASGNAQARFAARDRSAAANPD